MRVLVNIKDKTGMDFVTKELLYIKELAENDCERLAKECEHIIKRTIETKMDGGTGKLADSWFAEPLNLPGVIGWGVGDIDFLNKEVPYWYHIEVGSIALGANWQHYLPKGWWVNGRWQENSSGYSGIMPQTPVPARNYIADTLLQMEIAIQRVLAEKK